MSTKFKIEIKKSVSEQKKSIRIPTAPKGFTFKDKSKYNRKVKHKQGVRNH